MKHVLWLALLCALLLSNVIARRPPQNEDPEDEEETEESVEEVVETEEEAVDCYNINTG